MESDKNFLAYLRCPQCKQGKTLLVSGKTNFRVTNDGVECHDEIDWADPESKTRCPECNFKGRLKDFFVSAQEEITLELTFTRKEWSELTSALASKIRNLERTYYYENDAKCLRSMIDKVVMALEREMKQDFESEH